MPLAVEKKVPDFTAESTGGPLKLSALKGRKVVLYFYPKDNTPGCTTEGCDFAAAHAKFGKAGAVILGVSRDSLKSHENFKAKLDLPFQLLCDADETACALFDVIRMKMLYGKQVRGIERSTFLIDHSGKLAREWRGVKVDGHAADVLAALQSL